jgi:hypothetical protein
MGPRLQPWVGRGWIVHRREVSQTDLLTVRGAADRDSLLSANQRPFA